MLKILNFIKSLIQNHYDSCYTDMEYRGYASMNCCGGTVGGTYATDYLSESCINCPYLVMGVRKGGVNE